MLGGDVVIPSEEVNKCRIVLSVQDRSYDWCYIPCYGLSKEVSCRFSHLVLSNAATAFVTSREIYIFRDLIF